MSKRSSLAKACRIGFSALVVAAMSSVAVPVMTSGSADAQDLSGDIRFSWWGSTIRNQKTEDIIQMFEAANPGVKINREPGEWGSYWDKLTVQSASGNQPCAITMQSRRLAEYADPAILRPLDDLVASGELDVSGIDEAVLNSGRGPDGNLYFIPHGVFYFVLFMNKTAIEDAGLELPEDGWTWDEFASFARELSAKLPDGVYATGNMGSNSDPFATWVQGRGETLFNADGSVGFTAETVEDYFEYWEALRKDGVTEPADKMTELPDNVIDDTLLANGKIVIDQRPANQVDSHQKVLNVSAPGQEMTMVPYPVGPEGHGEDLGSNGFAIGANCSDSDAKIAAAWTNFFTQNADAAATYISDNGVVTVGAFRDAQLQNPDATAGQKLLIDMFGTVGPRAKPVYFPSGGYSAVSSALMSSYEAVAFEKSTPAEAAEDMISQVKRLMR